MNRIETILAIEKESKNLAAAAQRDDFDEMLNTQRQLAYWVRKVRVNNRGLLEVYSDMHTLVDLAAEIAFADIEEDDSAEIKMRVDLSRLKEYLAEIDRRS
jgi:hypothetical protein